MGRVMKEQLFKMMDWVFQARSRMEQIVSGTGTPGTRAAPTQAGNNDAKIGLRLDYGETFIRDGKMYRRVNLQVNKNAENPTLKALVKKNSHEVWSHADVLIEKTQEDVGVTSLGGSKQRKMSATSEPSVPNIPAHAGPVKPKSSLKNDALKEKAVKVFGDLATNLKD